MTHDRKRCHVVSGYPAMNHREEKRINALVRKLPELFKEVEILNKTVESKK